MANHTMQNMHNTTLAHNTTQKTQHKTTHLGVKGSKLPMAIRECSDLSGAHKGKVEWVEEQHHILLALGVGGVLALCVYIGVCTLVCVQ